MNRKLVGATVVVLFLLLVVLGTDTFMHQPLFRPNATQEMNATPPNFTNASMGQMRELRARVEEEVQPFYYLVPIAALAGLAVGAIVYHVLFERMPGTGSEKKAFRVAFLATLDERERKVVEILLANNGSVAQYELSRVAELSKVQTHRLVAKMEARGIITKRSLGKINKIELNKELMSALK
jgi:uncharacterized membrane protein